MKYDGVVGYPRSGNNFTSYCINNICGINKNYDFFKYCANNINDDSIGYAHGNTISFWDHLENKQENLVFIFRNYKECIVRHKEISDYNSIIEQLSGVTAKQKREDKTDYIALLNLYHNYPNDKKYLIYYEDLIKNTTEEIKKLIENVDYEKEKLELFFDNLKSHRNKSLKIYEQNIAIPQTKGKKLIFHSNKITKEDRIKIDLHLEENFNELFNKYLFRYKEN